MISSDIPDLEARLVRAERRAARERAARIAAEAIAEQGLRDLYESQQRLLLLQRITDGANRDTDVRSALQLAIDAVCEHTGWAFGNAYLRAPQGKVAAADIWCAADPTGLFDFVETSRRASFRPGQGLPGRVLHDVRPHWVNDVTTDGNFPRAALALRSGLHAGCAFPVMIGQEVAAVLEFFSRKPLAADAKLMAVMGQIGTQLGRVIERDRARRALEHDALHDAMTGLPNRTLFADRLRTAFARFQAKPAGELAVLVIDLDGFKAINDRLGHQAGDRLLVEVASRIDRCVRAAAAGHVGTPWQATLARAGGDEFTLLLADLADRAAAEQVAADLHACLAAAGGDVAAHLSTTASIGIAYAHGNYVAVDQLMRDADLAMYEAKATGRNRTVTLSASVGREIRRRLTVEHDLREALASDQFLLLFQPIVSLDRPAEPHGYEALIRWRHPQRGLVGPGEFIEVAEKTGLILFVGAWVLREACRAMVAHHARLAPGRRPFVSINISPRQFHQPDFARQVAAVVLETGIDPAAVKLEVTETVAVTDPERTRHVLEEIRAVGVRTSLDDFGTGYSSLSHLQQLPFDTLKIDRSFVSALGDSGTGCDFVRAILDLARSLGISVIAEGVETEAQAAALRTLGCDQAQGYLFGRPAMLDPAA